VWLQTILSTYQKTVFDERMQTLGGGLHEYVFGMHVTASIDPKYRRGGHVPFR
jgi:hypothetical protein